MSTPENTAAVLGTSWPEVFRALTLGEDLSDDVAAWAMGEMMAGDATEGQVGGFLLALAAKGGYEAVQMRAVAEKAEVAVAPGIGFGEHGDDYVRIAIVENEQRIRQAARNIRAYLKSMGVNVPSQKDD